jgi:hypothetical protein
MQLAALLLCSVLTVAAAFHQSQPARSCAASPVIRDTAPQDPNADSVGPANWYINADRTIWAGPVPDEGWPPGGKLFDGTATVKGQKTYWVRPAGAQLRISGRRLDASAPSVEAHIPGVYTTGFQIVALLFPTEGCWEVTAAAGESELQFVTEVKRSTVQRLQ